MKYFFLKSALLLLMFGTFLLACKSSKTMESKYVGEWHYTVEWEGTEYAVIMTINKVESGYSGSLSSDMGSVELDNLAIEEDKLKASYLLGDYEINFEGTFEGDTFSGLNSAGGYEWPTEAVRKNE